MYCNVPYTEIAQSIRGHTGLGSGHNKDEEMARCMAESDS